MAKGNRKRTLERIRKLLAEHGQLDTTTIFNRMRLQKNYQGKVYTNMVTINELSNILSKNKMFEKCIDGAPTSCLSGSTYQIAIWKLREDSD